MTAAGTSPESPPVVSPGGVIEDLHHHLDIARLTREVESVHQARVATRRLDVWLRLGGHRALRPDLRWLRKACGPVRDLDVLLALEPPPVFAGWLARRRIAEWATLDGTLAAPRVEGLLRALALLPPFTPKAARRPLRRLVAGVRRADRAFDRHPEDVEAMHTLRRCLRRLRYARQWLGLPVGPLADLQEALGRSNDDAVALRYLAAWPGADRLVAWRDERAEKVAAGLAEAGRMWHDSRHLLRRFE